MIVHAPLTRSRTGIPDPLLITVLALSLIFSPLLVRGITYARGSAYVRLNQIGYVNGETKQAILMATGSENGASFDVVDVSTGKTVYSAPIGAGQGKWNSTFPNTYLLDFSSVTTTGSYSIQVKGPIAANSPTFRIDTASNLYSGLLPNALFFYLAQRDGPHVDPHVLQRQPSHLTDEHAYTYDIPVYKHGVLQGLTRIGRPIDVSGGWFDAGDYLKFVDGQLYRCDYAICGAPVSQPFQRRFVRFQYGGQIWPGLAAKNVGRPQQDAVLPGWHRRRQLTYCRRSRYLAP